MTEPTGPTSSAQGSDPAAQGGPDVGPEATEAVVAQSTAGIDLGKLFTEPGSGSGHNSLNLTEGGLGGYAGVDVGGGAHASFGVPGGPSVELGGEGEFATQGQFEAEGRHLDADSTHVDSGDGSTDATGSGDGSGVELDAGDTGVSETGYDNSGSGDAGGWSDSSLDLNQGSVSADTATQLGGGVEASFSAPGMPEIGFGADGHFATDGGFDVGGTDLHADTSYGEGVPEHDFGFDG